MFKPSYPDWPSNSLCRFNAVYSTLYIRLMLWQTSDYIFLFLSIVRRGSDSRPGRDWTVLGTAACTANFYFSTLKHISVSHYLPPPCSKSTHQVNILRLGGASHPQKRTTYWVLSVWLFPYIPPEFKLWLFCVYFWRKKKSLTCKSCVQ